jgi:hypothetical protein
MKKSSVDNKFTKAGTTSAKVAPVEKGTLKPRQDRAAGGATGPATVRTVSKTATTSGARHGISVKLSGGTSPEAGATQANGRLIPPAINRTTPNFSAGAQESISR